MLPPTDDLLTEAADAFYSALNRYYLEPSNEALNNLITVSKHYRLLGCKIQLVKHGQCVIVSRYQEAECRPSL